MTRIEQLLLTIAGKESAPQYPNWAVTSDEVYLYAIIAGSNDVPQPLSRRQQFLYRRATGKGCIPAPINDEEICLAYFCGEKVDLPVLSTSLMQCIVEASPKQEEPTADKFICPVCGKEYTSAHFFEKHMKKHEEV